MGRGRKERSRRNRQTKRTENKRDVHLFNGLLLETTRRFFNNYIERLFPLLRKRVWFILIP